MSAIRMRTTGLASLLPPEASVTETTTEYVVHLPVPGFAREELEVELADDLVTIKGDQTRTAADRAVFCLHEQLEESFRLPSDVDTSHVTATFEQRALEIHAPRLVPNGREPRKIPIERRTTINAEATGV